MSDSSHSVETIQHPGTWLWEEVCECQIETRPELPGETFVLSDFDKDCPHRSGKKMRV